MILYSFDKSEIVKGRFIKRLNRFVGLVDVGGRLVKVHISDTGRLKEILTEGREIYITLSKNLKTDGKLLFAKMEDGFILLNTSYHSKIAYNLLKSMFPNLSVKPEYRYNESRIDFLVNDEYLVEVKGCNLLVDNLCLFPDAPTERGVKHLHHLIKSKKEGYKPILLILAFRDCDCFFPNLKTDKMFFEAFKMAIKEGVECRIFKLKVDEDFNIIVDREIDLCEERWALQKISSLL
ncbi:MAG: DNA/RNA nuclease SfsA [Hydrogenothermaceae bacterium]|nr:DNA/RNA nuclease SfsA [Hydrogenothermaceae bacterium]